jgi:hypothetical protein
MVLPARLSQASRACIGHAQIATAQKIAPQAANLMLAPPRPSPDVFPWCRANCWLPAR